MTKYTKDKSKVLTVRVCNKDYEYVQNLSKQTSLPISALLRQFIKYYKRGY